MQKNPTLPFRIKIAEHRGPLTMLAVAVLLALSLAILSGCGTMRGGSGVKQPNPFKAIPLELRQPSESPLPLDPGNSSTTSASTPPAAPATGKGSTN